MSQAGRFSSGGVPVGTVTQINGDTGFAVGPIINLQVGTTDGTPRFVGNDTDTINLNFSDAGSNTAIGVDSLAQSPHGTMNVSLGDFTLLSNMSGNGNTAIGYGAGDVLQTGSNNVLLGSFCAGQLSDGSYNICIGNEAGQAITTTDSSNILLNHSGATGQSNSLRIGDATGTGVQELSSAYICGIEGVNVGSVAAVVTINSDQLGSATITAGSGISVTPGANTITIAATGGGGSLNTLTGNTGGAVSPTASNINVLGAHGINTSGSGSTLTAAINNAITLGDLTLLTAGNPALTLTSGDLTISGTGTNAAGNINIPVTTTTGRSGVIEVNGSRFIHSFGNNNVFAGVDSGNFTLSGDGNSSFGVNSSQALTIGAGNSALGYQTLLSGADVNFNIAIGSSALLSLVDSDNNVAVGVDALVNSLHGESNLAIGRIGSGVGNSYTGSESHNVLIQNVGVLGESNTMRIGTTGSGTAEQNRTFLAGVQGVNVGSTATVVTMVSEQMGTATITAGSGITVTPTANTITISAAGGGSGSFVLIQTQTATAALNLNFTTGITSTYDNYKLLITNYIPSLTAQWLYLLISIDGGATYINTGYFTTGGFGTAGLPVLSVPNAGGDLLAIHGDLDLFNFTSSGFPATSLATGIWLDTTSGGAGDEGPFSGVYGTPATVNAFQLVQDDGSVFSGTFSLYGIAN